MSAIQKQLSYIKTFIEDCNETLEEISHVQKFSGTDLVDITVSIAETLVELEESLDEAEQELQYSIACFDCLVEQVSELQQLAI